jgi:hypothetical protein
VFGLRMLAVKSRNRRPASAISFGTSIADAMAGGTIAVGTMIASAWPDPAGFVVVRPDRLGLYRLLEFDAHRTG